MKLKHTIDFEGLKEYLESLKYSEIETSHNKPINPKLIEGDSICDIERFNYDKSTIPLERVINYGEPYLVDVIGGDLSICILSRRKYKLPTGRVIKSKFVGTIIKNTHELYGNYLNGYWKIPSQFIEAK